MQLIRSESNPTRFFPSSLLLKLAFGVGLTVSLLASAWAAPPPRQKMLQVYFVDVEGGQATLFVTPAHQSLLIDTGWPGNNGRDADRIVAAAKAAGISKLDYVLITHFHRDHVGGVPQLTSRIPVGTFIDHGVNRETTDAATSEVWDAYQKVLATGKFKHIVAKPGDTLPVRGMKVTVISSDGELISQPLPGAGQENATCKDAGHYPPDKTENARSLGTLVTFGKLRLLDLGDLTRDQEMKLMCPVNTLGKVDVYIVSHHGSSQSGGPALVHGIAPRVAIMDNGARKGGNPPSWDVVRESPNLEDLWQLHYSEEGGASHNVAAEFIANPDGPDAGTYLQLTARPDGSFEVFNPRTEKTREYPAR
jgi:beta-lactamase superfamily II metal-dependent hydrolase